MRAAAKAVIKLLGRANGKAGRFLVMERAQAAEIRAALFELHIATHHIDDVDTIQQILNKTLRDHAAGCRK
jgi:hypothetical protein